MKWVEFFIRLARLTTIISQISVLDGSSRINEPLHAVVENKLHRTALSESNNSILERNRALLQYIATLADSNKKDDQFNYEFVESLINGGADINIADQHGQSLFHEVARSWNIDVVKFLLQHGECRTIVFSSYLFREIRNSTSYLI